jgi:hypothetical protein
LLRRTPNCKKAPQFKWWGKASRLDGVKEPLLDS